MTPARHWLGAFAIALLFAACDGKLQFDQSPVVSDAGGQGGLADVPDGHVPCDACMERGLRCIDDAPWCVECLDNDDCHDASLPFCDKTHYRCIACSPPNLGCDHGLVCDGWSHSCVRTCAPEVDPDQDCGHSGLTCDTSSNRCIECEDDDDCTGSPNGPCCPPGVGRCMGCSSDADCAASGPARRCDPLTFKCVTCIDTSDCESGEVCGLLTRTCEGF